MPCCCTWLRIRPGSPVIHSSVPGFTSGLFFEQYSHEPYIAVARFLVHLAKVGDTEKDRLELLWKNGNAALQVMEDRLDASPFLAG